MLTLTKPGENKRRWPTWIAALFCISFFVSCLVIAILVATAFHNAGGGWALSLFLGASIGVFATWFVIWSAVGLGLCSASIVKRLKANTKLSKLLFVITGALILILLALLTRPSMPVTEAVAITITAETNIPGTDRKFRLFAVTNRADYDIRWHGDGIEIEGRQGLQGRLVSPALPGKTFLPVLKSRESLELWIGEPLYSDEPGQWRYTMSFTKYDLRERWHDQAMKGKVPTHIGRFVFVDSQKILNPTNYTHVTSDWITNPSKSTQ